MSRTKNITIKRRTQWSSQRAFILSTTAAAVGLGNIWRFPYIAGQNGGASFIIAYIIAVICIGLPLMIVEITAGREEAGGVVRTFAKLQKFGRLYGWFVVVLTALVLSYYLVVTGWTLGYAVESLQGNVTIFSQFTSGYKPIIYFFASLVITALVAAKGVKLIEKLSAFLMPMLIIVVIGLAVYGLTTDGAGQAMKFLFTPDFSSFFSVKLWALAFGQAFYSLSIGQGYLTTYGSFVPKKVNVPKATAIVAGVETSVALVAGLMIFPIIFTFGLNPAEGTQLVFDTLPLGFNSLAYGRFLSIIFFWLLFFAAISSCVAGMEVIKTAFQEELRQSNRRAVVLGALALIPFGLVASFSFTPLEIQMFGRPFLEFMDIITANQIVVISGLLGGAIIGWGIHKSKFFGLYHRKYRHLAHHTIITVRYLWVVVLGIMMLSL